MQPQYSILDRRVRPGVLNWCREKNTGFLGYSPMHSGLLTGKVSREWYSGLPDNDWRKHKQGHPVTQYLQEPHGPLAAGRHPAIIAQDSGHTVGQLAVAWVLSHPEVTSAIVGARRPGKFQRLLRLLVGTDSGELERIEIGTLSSLPRFSKTRNV